jgi:hypothetical protein
VPGLDRVQRLLGFPPLGFCALRADRSLWCWGFGYTGDTSLPATGVGPRSVADRVSDFGFAERFPGVCFQGDDGTTSCVELRADQPGECAYWADDAERTCLFRSRIVRVVPRDLTDAGRVHFGEPPIPYRGHETCWRERGQVLCQGDNLGGKLGDTARVRADAPTSVPGLRDVVSVSDSGRSTCAVRSDGVALCWGRNRDRELVVAPDACPCPALDPEGEVCNARPTVLPLADVAQVLLTNQGMFALTRAGAVLRARPTDGAPPSTPGGFELLAGIPPSTRLVRGYLSPYATCALTRAGDVYCFGQGADLGDGARLVRRAPAPIPGITGVVEVHADATGACARRGDGTVTCWGDPEAPRGLQDIISLGKPCALARDGHVWCWGANLYGEMGLGRSGRAGLPQDKEVVHVPLPVPGLRDITAISSSLGTTCALDRRGVVRCWGPFGPKFPTLSPTEIRGLPPAREIWSAGGRQCALAADGQVWCFGGRLAPAPRSDLGRAAHLPSHGPGPGPLKEAEDCIVDPNGDVHCAKAPAPIRLSGRVKQLSVGSESGSNTTRACALLDDGDLVCWGPSYCADQSALCVGGVWGHTEKILDGVVQVSVGPQLACAVRTDGTVWCWGRADDQRTDRLARVDLAAVGR